MQIRIFLYLLIVVFLQACVEKYNPQINDYKNLPVVEGTITNEPGPYIIKLSQSSMVYDPKYIPIPGANIIISDNYDFEETLTETEPGVYSTSPTGIIGEIGKKYRITITVNGKTYQSEYEKLEEPIEIDSIYTKIETRETREGQLEGLQFYIDTKALDDNDHYFLWKPVETYKYKGDLLLHYIYTSLRTRETIKAPDYTVCWHTSKILETFTYSAENLDNSKVSGFPLHYVSTETKRLSEKYSLLVKQYSISKQAHIYWGEIKKQNSESGSLYASQAFQIKGNLINIDKPDEMILGYFMAAGVSEKRVFIDKPPLISRYVPCKASNEAYNVIFFEDSDPTFPVYVSIIGDGEGEVLGVAGLGCFDCAVSGGNPNKPDFWED